MPKEKINYLALVSLIYKKGKEILPYSTYVKSGKSKSCKVLANKSKRYKEYVCYSLPYYNVSRVPASNLSCLIKEDERL
jgi:hypothetical protein